MTHDPYPLLQRIMKVIPSKESLGVDLEDPEVWTRPPVTDYQYLVVHWGGGPNTAGDPIEEPTLTRRQKVAAQLGRCFRILRIWHHYHQTRGMSAIAYSSGVDPLFGRLFALRRHRYNGGQWGRINSITHAVVLIMGFGQKATRLAWRTIGLIWFASGAPEVVGHRFFNDWKETQTTTTCPGDYNATLIATWEYINALGLLKWRALLPKKRGCRVRAITARLADLGYLDKMRYRYTREVRDAVVAFQAAEQVQGEPGVVGPALWHALAVCDRRKTRWPLQVERWRPLVAKYFEPEDVERALGIIRCESVGDPNAISRKEWVGTPPPGYDPDDPSTKASGLFQQLPPYWEDRSRAAGWEGANIFEPEANIAVSAWLVYDGWHPETAPNWQHWSGESAGVEGCLEWANAQIEST